MKIPRKDSEHSREKEFTVVLEDIQSQFRVFGEGLGDVQNRLERIENRFGKVENDVAVIKSAIPIFSVQVSGHETRIIALEHSR
ncbi:MAG: hypothetical protein A2351_04245 [Omnitrophica bacterium RIFOXYB12_FULL_50_7]|nr:MAG: hypothetical protein A2351_04245 [Omnitrophica bacterium RIFOXYB12_FULL_50_7]